MISSGIAILRRQQLFVVLRCEVRSMSVQSVPTIRAAHLLPYLNFFNNKKIPFDHALSRFRLPTMLGDDPETRLPLLPAVKFLAYIERSECISDLGILASDHISIKLLSHANRQVVLSAPTLGAALEAFTHNAFLESSVVEAWMVMRGGQIKLCKNHRVSLDDEEIRLLQLHFIFLFLAIVRFFAGSGWTPRTLGLRSRIPVGPAAGERFPGTQFLLGQETSWLDLPKDMLDLRQGAARAAVASYNDQDQRILRLADDFPSSLKRILKAYLSDGYPSVDLAAEITGMSVRTLQRNLARSGLTYSKLVELTRFEAASEMLQDPSAKIIDVAYAVGYEDPSHFSRAFRRMAGTSPRGFRVSGAA
jgi:AraC-like DNA-binding protein